MKVLMVASNGFKSMTTGVLAKRPRIDRVLPSELIWQPEISLTGYLSLAKDFPHYQLPSRSTANRNPCASAFEEGTKSLEVEFPPTRMNSVMGSYTKQLTYSALEPPAIIGKSFH